MSNRDSQTLLSSWRAKYPGSYDNVDDATLYSAIVKKHPEYSDIPFQSVPKAGNFLQNAINANRINGNPMTMAGALPSNINEVKDLGKIALSNTIDTSKNMGPISWGVNITHPTSQFENQLGAQFIEKSLEPETDYGKVVGGQAKIAPYVGLALEGIPAIARGIDSLINPKPIMNQIGLAEDMSSAVSADKERLSNISDYLGKRSKREVKLASSKGSKSIEDLSSLMRSTKESQAMEAKDLASKGKLDLTNKVQSAFEKAKSSYSNMVENLHPEDLNIGDLYDALDQTVKNKGLDNTARMFPDSPESNIIRMRDRIGSMLPKDRPPIIDMSDPRSVTSVNDIKNFKNEVFNLTKSRPDIHAEFLNNYSSILDNKGAGQFLKPNRQYREAYNLLKSSKEIPESSIRGVALGKLPPSTEADLLSKQSGANTDIISKAKNLRESHVKSQEDLAGRINSIAENIPKQIQNVKTKYAQGISSLKSRASSLDPILEDLSSGKQSLQNDLQKIISNRELAKNIGSKAIKATGLVGLEEIIRHLWNRPK